MRYSSNTRIVAIDSSVYRTRSTAMIGLLVFLALSTLLAGTVQSVEPLNMTGRHPLYHKSLPPGAIWQSPAAVTVQQGTYQPVAFSGPAGVKFSLPQAGTFTEGDAELMAGLMVGAVYRFRVTGIPNAIGAELYPTVELIGRLYPPPGLETSFPIPINLSQTDLEEALNGNLVTRVIYLEDPQTATPLAQKRTESRPIDIPLDQDALATADSFGRPIAIVRVGSKSPPRAPVLQPQFYFGYPTWAPILTSDELNKNAQPESTTDE